ncbi:class I SAM-dependent methyltransferase [Flavivirga sp. 57AJ16]|uniref:class I SAM-dependent methyltransferase n=1 Tax=Flavivirga sp. 57AJ16 TaxID=3025307 RepID=UPI0023671A49|nr:methyltransferase domain-containing protein [Flavivirga sp. 57AJ16]MDD7886224.1 methyltransferase domain-containing protein [Flavivirga sp. 57AJ16]
MAIKEIKYNKIGSNYNETRKADPFITQRILEHLEPKKGGIYLDIGCGTGNYTKEFRKSGVHFIGMDPSQKMLEKAQSGVNDIDWRLGTVENLDLEQNSIDGVVAMLTIHHWADLNKAFSEILSLIAA